MLSPGYRKRNTSVNIKSPETGRCYLPLAVEEGAMLEKHVQGFQAQNEFYDLAYSMRVFSYCLLRAT